MCCRSKKRQGMGGPGYKTVEEEQKYHYELESGIFRIFMPFFLLVIVAAALYTFMHLFYDRKQHLINETIQPSILLSIKIIAQAGALNSQDEFKLRIMELETARDLLQPIRQQTKGLSRDDPNWYRTNFGRYIYKHGSETKETYHDDLTMGQDQYFYTSPLVTASNEDKMRTAE